jgi:hypothetical protein
LGDEVKDDIMLGLRDTDGRQQKNTVLPAKPKGKRPFRTSEDGWEGNIKIRH